MKDVSILGQHEIYGSTLTKSSLKSLYRGELALIVFAPDAEAASLIPTLDAHIRRATISTPVFRSWVQHTPANICTFYPDSEDPDNTWWPFVERLFTFGPVMATLWRGDNVLEQVKELKGASHPANSSAAQIRGQYWCDNQICNLMHVSDTPEEIERELFVLFNTGMKISSFLAASNSPWHVYSPQPRHNSNYTAVKILVQIAKSYGVELPPLPDLSINTASDFHYLCRTWLQSALTSSFNDEVKEGIWLLLKCTDINKACEVLGEHTLISKWERFMLEIIQISEPYWS